MLPVHKAGRPGSIQNISMWNYCTESNYTTPQVKCTNVTYEVVMRASGAMLLSIKC